MLRRNRVLDRSVLRSLSFAALVGLALAATTACADSTGPRNDCTIVNGHMTCYPD
jgi:hypothetical protein